MALSIASIWRASCGLNSLLKYPMVQRKKNSTKMSVHGNKLFLFGGFVTKTEETTDEFHQFDLETSMNINTNHVLFKHTW